MSQYKQTYVYNFPIREKYLTPQSEYWNEYKGPTVIKETSSIISLDVTLGSPYRLAITSSTKIQLYDLDSDTPLLSFTNFKKAAYGGTFRKDGQLVVSGCEDGIVRIFSILTKSQLREFKGHSSEVHVTKFASDNYHIISGSDDKSLKYWDIATGSVVSQYQDHMDYIRAGVALPTSSHLFLTGSYDHTAKMFDFRCQQNGKVALFKLDHTCPIECVLMLPNERIAFTAGGNMVKVWDVMQSGRELHSFSPHSKTITALALGASSNRLITASLDRQVRVHDTSTYDTVHTQTYSDPILSIANAILAFAGHNRRRVRFFSIHTGSRCQRPAGFQSPNKFICLRIKPRDQYLVVGTVNGVLSIRKRRSEEERSRKVLLRKGSNPATDQFLTKLSYAIAPAPGTTKASDGQDEFEHGGKDILALDTDVIIEEMTDRKKMRSFDKCFKRFQFSQSFDKVFSYTTPYHKSPHVVVSYLRELIRRDKVSTALAGRDFDFDRDPILKNFISFLVRNLEDPRFAPILIDVASVLVEIYAEACCSCIPPPILTTNAPYVEKLVQIVNRNLNVCKGQMCTIGVIDSLMVQGKLSSCQPLIGHDPPMTGVDVQTDQSATLTPPSAEEITDFIACAATSKLHVTNVDR